MQEENKKREEDLLRTRLKNISIVVTSDEPWGNVWHTQLHFANELSNFTNVIFVNPPAKGINYNDFSYKVNDNLRIITYKKFLPVKFGRLSTTINDFLTSREINRYLPEDHKIILWRIDHFRMHKLYNHNVIYTIYHVIDHWVKFKEDNFLARISDLVIYTSPRFTNHYKLLSQKSINIPQGVSNEEFKTNKEVVSEWKNKYGEFIISSGTLSDAVDIDILRQVALRFKKQKLVLAGPLAFNEQYKLNQFEELIRLTNVEYVGVIPGKELNNIIAASTICLIHYPFNLQSEYSVRSPLKVINYLAQYKPVVTSFRCEIEPLEGKSIFYSDNISDYLNYIDYLLAGKINIDKNSVKAYLNNVRYTVLIQKIINFLMINEE